MHIHDEAESELKSSPSMCSPFYLTVTDFSGGEVANLRPRLEILGEGLGGIEDSIFHALIACSGRL
jgi:hypothetical protein